MCLLLFLIFALDLHCPVSLHILQFVDVRYYTLKKRKKEINICPHPSERAFSLAARVRNWLYIDLFRRCTISAVGCNLTSFFFSSLVLFYSPVNIVFLFNWSIVDLLCFVSFRCPAKWLNYHIYTCKYLYMWLWTRISGSFPLEFITRYLI